MKNKNPIDEKFDSLTKTFTTSRTVFRFINLLWYILIILGILLIISGTIYCSEHESSGDAPYAIWTGGFIILIAIILILATRRKIKNIKLEA